MARRPLERIALHQTRLRTPGLGLDANGVAVGARGLVLLPTLERLVAFLAIYTRERSFADLLGERELGEGEGEAEGLVVAYVRSPLGTRELVLSFPGATTALLDVVADVARLAGGLTFTGSGRHFVQYRDQGAPFGYDAVEPLRVEGATDLALHHSTFTQVYARERPVDLAALVARLEPRPDPTATAVSARPLWVVAEPGIGPALVAYLARSGVEADVGILELPPASAFDDAPRRLTLARIPELPPRLSALVTRTPGLRAFAPAGRGVAVEVGHRHPIQLVGLPLFGPNGLVLLPARHPGETRVPLALERLPTMAHVTALADVALEGSVAHATASGTPESVAIALRLSPGTAVARAPTASLVPLSSAPLLRRLAYALPPSSLASATLARVRPDGLDDLLVLRLTDGVEAIPLGALFSERAPGLFVLAGHDLVPACEPAHLARALGASSEAPLFVFREPGDPTGTVRAFAVGASAFVPLASALLTPESWGARTPVELFELARAELDEPLGTVTMGDLGFAPLRDVPLLDD